VKTLAGLLFVTVLTMSAGCAQKDWIDRTLVTVDVTGTWYGRGATNPPIEFLLELAQQGSVVKGSLQAGLRSASYSGDLSGPIEGTVAGDVFTFRNTRGSMEGELTVSGDEMNGRASTYAGSRPVSLRRVDPSSRPDSPRR
jgi:hypothetical protein